MRPLKLTEREPLALHIAQGLIRALETARNQSVLRFARLELRASPLRLVLDALDSEE